MADLYSQFDNRTRQMMARRAMSGRDPTLTALDLNMLERRRASSEENNQAVERGVGELLLGQPIRAGLAVGEAFQTPSIANVTNAGVQSALAAFRPLAAAKVAGGGFAAAAASDALSDANAQSSNRRRQPEQEVASIELPGLTPQQGKEYNALLVKMQRGAFGSAADRRSTETRATELRKLSDDFSRSSAATDRQEYSNAVRRAESARDSILADRPKKFSETSVGAVYDRLGIVAPAVIAAGMGGLTRAGLAASGVTNNLANYGVPMAVGAATGGVAANYPLGHELMFAPAANPERRAFETYGRELPPDHPRKQEWMSYAEKSLPQENPAREVASREFYDPVKFIERTGLGVAEGLLGGLAGSEAVSIALRPFKRRPKTETDNKGGGGKAPDDGAPPGGQPADGPPRPVNYRTYPSLPASARQSVQEAYVVDRILRGSSLPSQAGSRAIKNSLREQGVDVPVSSGRVQTTNALSGPLIDQFVAQYGRAPTRQEFATMFNNKTLAVPLAVAAGAGLMDFPYSGSP